MAIDPEITRNVEQVRNATYGKDVREAIARGLELCYGYTSGETADEAAQRANAAAERVEGLIDDSEQAVHDVQEALQDLDHIIEVSPDTPTYETNKIWIQPQDNTEYKVATFAAYETLWERMNEIDVTYQKGHGGVESIVLDPEYSERDPEDGSLIHRYVVSYSDETTSEFFLKDGATGPTGPVDTIVGTTIHYQVVDPEHFEPIPPETYVDNLPPFNPGDYLWTITEINYLSGAQSYIYGLTKMGLDGLDGDGAMNKIRFGEDGEWFTGDVTVPMDQEPSAGSAALLTSGSIYNALSTISTLDSPEFTGTPTAPTPELSDDSTRLATTEFVQDLVVTKSATARQVSVTMNQKSLTYTDPTITSYTTVVGFTDIDWSKFSKPIQWETTADHKLTLTTEVAPTSSTTFKVLLLDSGANVPASIDPVETHSVAMNYGLTAHVATYGRVCMVFINGPVNAAVGASAILGALPVPIYPVLVRNFGSTAYLELAQTGYLSSATALAQGSFVQATFTYITG